jgi:hypothetical protein
VPREGENNMLGFISELTIEQLLAALAAGTSRKITAVHIHHTWRPTAGQWRGKKTVEAMRRVHMEERGWNDIAQHLTIGPDGSLWSGRALAAAPASAIGHNGNANEGPFMIEMAGDFDIGGDPFCPPQSTSAYRVVGLLCLYFSLRAQDVRFHREFNAAKSCPGTQLALEPFRAEVVKEMAARKKDYDSWKKSRSTHLPSVYAGVAPRARGAVALGPEADAELTYDTRAGADWTDVASRGFFDPTPTPSEREVFNRHVINLSMGRLSDTGIVKSSPASLDALIGHIEAWATTQTNPRVAFYAHGGLVSEKKALYEIVLPQSKWWLDNGVYPIFFVWETGLFEVLGRQVPLDNAERGLKEVILESTFGRIGREAWDKMKDSAQYSSQEATADRFQGGANIFADKLIAWLSKPATPALSLHAVGHSAGSIFLGHWLPMFIEKAKRAKLKKPITTLSLLAPACTSVFFKEKLLPPIQAKEIASFAEFTMMVAAERADTLIGIYQGSLLYFVRNACERECPPLLGLEESVRGDAALLQFFALSGGVPQADLVFSPTTTNSGRFASQALTHGDFDNDPATMNSVLRRILNLADEVALPDAMTALDTTRAAALSPARGIASAGARSSGQVFALCIGIDNYPDKPLTGCVADAKLWAETLQARGAIIHAMLLNAAATKRGIIDAWQAVCARAKPGDTVVIQYAGHGTQVPDLSGDETDRLDEAWVPYDYDSGNALVDDEIGGLIDNHTPHGVSLVLITDCCNSGSNTRAKSTTLDKNSRSRLLRLEDKPAFVQKFIKTSARWSRELHARGNGEPGREIHFAGCQDEQSSFESDGHGAFTLAAVSALNALPEGGRFADWDRVIREKFATNGPQVPNFKALPSDAKRAVFSNYFAPHSGTISSGSEMARVLSKLSALEVQVAAVKATLDKLV